MCTRFEWGDEGGEETGAIFHHGAALPQEVLGRQVSELSRINCSESHDITSETR